MTYQDGVTIGQKVNETASLMDNQPPVLFTWTSWILVSFMIGATFLRLYLEYKEDMKAREESFLEPELILNQVAEEPLKVGDRVSIMRMGNFRDYSNSAPVRTILMISECGRYVQLGLGISYPSGWVGINEIYRY